LQPGANADRGGERVVAAGPGRRSCPIRRRARRGTTEAGRTRRPRAAPPGRAVGRTDAEGGGGARAGGPAVPDPRRRADRKPGQPFVGRGLGSPAVAVRRRRHSGGDGDTRPGRGALWHPRATSCRRAGARSPRHPGGYARPGTVMHRLRAAGMSFRRVHLAALIADWRRTLLSAFGVALGVSVVLGTLILKFELVRPFDAFGPSLTHAAAIGVLEVTPDVKGRLPIETVNRLRAEVTGAEAVVPVVAGFTPVHVPGSGTH